MNGRRVTGFAAYQKETKDDTSNEQPSSNVKGDCYTVLCLWAIVEDLVGPLLGGQHGDCCKNIQDVDKEVLEHDDVEPQVPREKGKGRGRFESSKSRRRALHT